MRDRLRTLLGIESGEEAMVSLLLTQSVFLGIFIGAFDISAHSLLLSTFDVKIMAQGYVISGITGLIITSLYSWFQLKLKFRYFAIINLIFATSLTFILWTALILSQVKWIILIVFVMFGPLNIMTLQGFWGTAEHLFTKGQRKRLFPLAEMGLIIGIIVISYTIPILMSFNFQSHEILLVSAISVFVATLVQAVIGKKFSLANTGTFQLIESPEKRKSPFNVFYDDPLIRITGVYVALSILSAFFIQYCFMAVTRQQYPVAEDMAAFLGLFTGSMMIFILIIKRYVFAYVHRKYGILTCITISPVLISGISAIAAAIGLLMGIGPATASGFILFFMFLAIGRLFSKSLNDSVETPALNIIYQALEKSIKEGLQTLVKIKFNEIMVIFSGLILTCLGLFSLIKLVHFSLLLFGISLIWLFVSFRLFREYRKSLIRDTEKAVKTDSESTISANQAVCKNRFCAEIQFRTDYFRLISGDLSALDKIHNKWYFEKIADHAISNKEINLIPVLKRIAVNNTVDEGVRQHAAEVAGILQKHTTLLKYSDEKRFEAIKVLSGSRRPQTSEILRLLRDNSIESKRLAIFMIGKFRMSDLLSEVCDCLNIPGLTIDAYEVLKIFGSEAEDQLVRYYIMTSGNIRLNQTILLLLGNTCSKETIGFLFSRLWSNSRQLKELAVKCLINCKFKPTEEEKQRLNQLTSDVIGLITWNLAARLSLEGEHDKFLLEKISREVDRWNEFLFNILSVTYNSDTIARIRENSESEITERIRYGLQMIGQTVSESIKPKLISLLDEIPEKNKLNNLFQFFPGEIPGRKNLLEDIINRDYNLISLWTKACALRSIAKIEGEDMAESVTALLFCPEEIIQEESASLIARSNPRLYISASERIPDSIKKRLDNIVNGKFDNKELLYEKVQLLSRYFDGIQEDDLLLLASEIKFISNFNAESLKHTEDSILWISDKGNGSHAVHVFRSGEIDTLSRKYLDKQNIICYSLPLNTIEEYHFQFPDKSYDILKFIDKNED